MTKRQASLLSFYQSTHKRQREFEEKADDDQDQELGDSDRQDIQVEDSPKESEHESEHSSWSITYDVNIEPPIFW